MGRGNSKNKGKSANKPKEAEKKCLINKLPDEVLSQIFIAGWHRGVDFYDADCRSIYKYSEPAKEAIWLFNKQRYEGNLGPKPRNKSCYTLERGPYGNATEDLSRLSLPVLSFNVKVSHVCRLWRHVALDTPSLWSQLHFFPWEQLPFARCTEWSKRVKNAPVRVTVNLEPPAYPCRRVLEYVTAKERKEVIKMDYYAYNLTEEELSRKYSLADTDEDNEEVESVEADSIPNKIILRARLAVHTVKIDKERYNNHCNTAFARVLELIKPLVRQWESFELSAKSDFTVRVAFKQLAATCINAAPKLNAISLVCFDEDYEELDPLSMHDPTDTNGTSRLSGQQLLFGGALPALDTLRLDYVALNWLQLVPPSPSFGSTSSIDVPWRGLTDLCLSRLPTGSRPSYDLFVKILEGSPSLNELRLIDAGPLAPTYSSVGSNQLSTVYLSSLWALKLDLDPRTALCVLDMLHAPYLSQLSLSLFPEDVHDPQDDPLPVLRRLREPMRLPTIIPSSPNAPVFTPEDEAALAAQHTFLHSIQTLILLGFQRAELAVEDVREFYEALPTLKELAFDLNAVEKIFFRILNGPGINGSFSDMSSSDTEDETESDEIEEQYHSESEEKLEIAFFPQLETLAVSFPHDMVLPLIRAMESGLANITVLADRASPNNEYGRRMLEDLGASLVNFQLYLDMLENK